MEWLQVIECRSRCNQRGPSAISWCARTRAQALGRFKASPLGGVANPQHMTPILNNCLRGILVVPFAAAGIARAAFHMDSNGIEQARSSSSIAQWHFAFTAGDIRGVALYAAQFLVFFLFLLNSLREPLL